MAKLTHAELKAHDRAMSLVASEKTLSSDDIIDVADGYHEGATHANSAHSAFFTPWDLAITFALEVPDGGRVLDLCAGIGVLSAAARVYHQHNGRHDFTLVELNPAYCEIARRLLPDATVICGSIFDPAVQAQLAGERFDFAISNPPFGARNTASGTGPRYTGRKQEYAVMDLAADYARAGAFILPLASAPRRPTDERKAPLDFAYDAYQKFVDETGIEILPNLGIDTSFADNLWRGTKIKTEIALCDFDAAHRRRLMTAFDDGDQRGLALAA
ncbi:methyltransferase [Sphingosinicella sp. BN140058]|uniref:methyltransferase n=1 Tax=Sphingosinicella sp. BN140058 TaxID=1892855 RepID=UPI0013ED98DF|nr:methyltransferase [Sphingosinicella sp. BN140058]